MHRSRFSPFWEVLGAIWGSQDPSKSSQDTSKTPPRHLQGPKSSQDTSKTPPRSQNAPKMVPKSSQNAPKMLPRGLQKLEIWWFGTFFAPRVVLYENDPGPPCSIPPMCNVPMGILQKLSKIVIFQFFSIPKPRSRHTTPPNVQCAHGYFALLSSPPPS